MPRPFVAVGTDSAVIGTKLEVADLMGVLEYVEPARSVEVGHGDPPTLHPVESLLEAGVVWAIRYMDVLIPAESYIAAIRGDRRRAQRIAAIPFVDGDDLARRRVQPA
jgi:hypothetical protein